MAATIRLPFPPSANKIWRHVVIGKAARVLLSREGREYRVLVSSEVRRQCPWITAPVHGRLRVEILAVMPDRRNRDLGNLEKASMDALTHAGIWADDGQIDHLTLIRGKVHCPGWLEVTIERLPEPQKTLI